MNKKEYNYKESIKYFNGDELAGKVFVDKYALKDEKENQLEYSPDEMHRRLAKEFARIDVKYCGGEIEDYFEQYYEVLKNFKYIIPGGSGMSGIGNTHQVVSISNCFVVGNEHDSYGAIINTDEEQVQLMKRRGGVGHDLSYIRPKGTMVKNSALTSTGVVPFMERYSNSTREVAQDGRRGALMLSTSIIHPDSESFIDAKMEQGKITGANISVKLTDNFMDAVVNNHKFVQSFPISEYGNWNHLTKDNVGYGLSYHDDDLIHKNLNSKSYHKIKDANKLYRKITDNAWKSAEPGVLFWDTIIRESLPDCYSNYGFRTVSTNPCVSADTNILTKDLGFKKIIDYIDKEVELWNGYEWTKVTPFKTSDSEDIYLVKFSDGSELKCTKYHKFILKGNTRKELNDIIIGDKLEKFELPYCEFERINQSLPFSFTDKQWYTQGFYAGDGTIAKEEGREDRYFIDLYGDKISLLNYLDGEKYGNLDEVNNKLRVKVNVIFPNKNEIILTSSIQSRLSFLAGVIDSDGTLNDSGGSIAITSIDREFLYNLKSLLITLGIRSSLGVNKEATKKNIKGKEYDCKTCYRLTISAWEVKKLMNLGLKTNRVPLIANPNRDSSRFITVDSIELIGNESVYCFTDPKNNSGLFNHVMTANCGEIPLCPYDSCRLLSINLFSYVVNPFTAEAYFDFKLFQKHVYLAQRMMDSIVDLEIEKINSIINKIKSDPEPNEIKQTELDLWSKILYKTELGRRTGTGITAEGDMIAAMGLRYGTKDATDFSTLVHRELAVNVYKASMYLANEKGCFKIYDSKLEENNPFIERILAEFTIEERELYNRVGRRNIACLTIKCGGSIK